MACKFQKLTLSCFQSLSESIQCDCAEVGTVSLYFIVAPRLLAITVKIIIQKHIYRDKEKNHL